MTFQRKMEIIGGVIAIIAFVLWGLDQMLQHTASLQENAALKKLDELKSELPKKIDDRTTLVDMDFERHEAMARKWVNATYKYVVDLSVDGTPFDLHETEQSVQQQTCADPNTSRAIKEGDSYSFHYASKEGVSLGDFMISACP